AAAPQARRGCDRPVGAGRSTALRAVLAPHQPWARPANRYQDRHAVSRFSSQAGTQTKPTVLLHPPPAGGMSPLPPPITLPSPPPCDRRARSTSLHILPAVSACRWPVFEA